jgi:hypothetical protein
MSSMRFWPVVHEDDGKRRFQVPTVNCSTSSIALSESGRGSLGLVVFTDQRYNGSFVALDKGIASLLSFFGRDGSGDEGLHVLGRCQSGKF